MELVRFAPEMLDTVKSASLYLIGRSEAYWDELFETVDGLSALAGAFDPAERKQGTVSFRGKSIRVSGLDALEEIPGSSMVVITDDYFWEIFEQLKQMEAVRENFYRIYFFPNRETCYDLRYREKYKVTPLRDIILFRSGPHASGYVPGMDFADNTRALFEYMLREGFNEKYELVWLVHDPAEYEERYSACSRVRFLPYDGSTSKDRKIRDSYYEALCLAKYIFFTDAYGFARHARPGQIRVQLWHGCGIKNRVNFVRCENRYEYTTVISGMYAELHADEYGLRPDQVLVTGYPKDDWLFHPIGNWRERFCIPEASKYIFWLPTFRTAGAVGLSNLDEQAFSHETGLPVVDSMDKMDRLNEMLAQRNIVLVIKLHPFQKRDAIMRCGLSNIRLLENGALIREDVQINELLGNADALISDYSSAAVDYALLDRPMAFTLDDCEAYGGHRGFNWPNVLDWLPGEQVFAFEDFLRFVDHVADGSDPSREKRQRLRRQFHTFFDDGSSRRVLDALRILK